jgi:hypothetical protein
MNFVDPCIPIISTKESESPILDSFRCCMLLFVMKGYAGVKETTSELIEEIFPPK